MNPESSEIAKRWIKYFNKSLDACINDGGENIEIWQKGLDAAKEWHRLIISGIEVDDFSAFMGIIHANKYRNSVWHSFALEVYDWASSKSNSLLPRKVFFRNDGLERSKIDELAKTNPLKNAQTLYEVFYQYSNDDPNTEVWEEGFKFLEEWIRVLESENFSSSEVAVLCETVCRSFSKFMGDSLWLDTMLAFGYWCKSLGKLELIPKPHRLLFEGNESANP